jgi:hypothetical protein
VYTAVLSNQFGKATPFRDHILSQVVVAGIAVLYALYVGQRTGYFGR